MTGRWIADHAWLGGPDLSTSVLIEVEGSRFRRVEPGGSASDARRLSGVVIPGMVNAHSHAFHRLLRGRTHGHGGDFWVWRELMYGHADDLTPDSYEEIATEVYREMANAGITTVGEFHYVHHQPGGAPYRDPNEMGHALIGAARAAGIRIGLLDAGYLRAGFGDQELSPTQERFSDGSVEAWLERVHALAEQYQDQEDVRIGLAPHSVRALNRSDLAALADRRPPGLPLHIHVSEQPAENQECLLAWGLTPVGLLGEAGLLGPGTTAIHATHLSAEDVESLGGTGSGVCLCPTTERDLGDGLGPAAALSDEGSPLSVGSDSHAVIDLFEEMRGIELHNRLATHERGHLAPEHLMEAGTRNGSLSLAFEGTGIEVGANADFVLVDSDSYRTRAIDAVDGTGQLVFSATAADVVSVFVGGRQVV